MIWMEAIVFAKYLPCPMTQSYNMVSKNISFSDQYNKKRNIENLAVIRCQQTRNLSDLNEIKLSLENSPPIKGNSAFI